MVWDAWLQLAALPAHLLLLTQVSFAKSQDLQRLRLKSRQQTCERGFGGTAEDPNLPLPQEPAQAAGRHISRR